MKVFAKLVLLPSLIFTHSAIASDITCPSTTQIKSAKFVRVEKGNVMTNWKIYSAPFIEKGMQWNVVLSDNQDESTAIADKVLKNAQDYLKANAIVPHKGPMTDQGNVTQCGYLMNNMLLYINTYNPPK